MKIGDTGGVLEYLKQRQLDDPNFFYAIQIDDDGLIANIFWVDSQMTTDYGHFGDVVCFDTTYRKNKEGRPFALFVGVNHHKQTIVFGAALLYDETALTFMWLFDTFAKAMSGKQPETILTDQDQAMAKALAEKWPNTHHRLCIWHIYQNATIHLSNVFAQFKSFAKDFSSCIYDYDKEEEFLSAWQVMLEKYGLESNEWLERMFKIRQQWALVYGRQSFCADMMTTQRSESMNSVLKRYVSYEHNLLQFFQHFDRLIEDRRYEEVKADLKTCHSTPLATFPVEIAKHAASIYTHKVFESFQDALHKAYDSKIELCSEIGDICEYKVTPFKRNYQHTVIYDSSKIRVHVVAKNLSLGGFCSHTLKVLSSRNIVNIPDVYIKKRWTKKAKKYILGAQPSVDIPSDLVNENGERKIIGAHYKELCILHNQLAKIAALTVESFSIAKNNVLKTFEEVYASLENVKTMRPSRAKSVLQKDHLLNNIGDLGKEVGDITNNLEVRGWKNKEKKPIRPGRRPKSGLERSTRNKNKQQKRSSVTNEHDIIGNNQQENETGGSNLSVAYHTEGCFLPSVEAFQIGQPIVQEQYDSTTCYSRNQQQSRGSLTQLLQQQEVGQLGSERGFNQLNNFTSQSILKNVNSGCSKNRD